MTETIDSLKIELSKANRKVARLTEEVARLTEEVHKWKILGSQHRAELNDKVSRWTVRYVLVVEYDFCKKTWHYWVHQSHLRPIKVSEGTALTFNYAKAEAESLLKDLCNARVTPPDLKKLTLWRPQQIKFII